MTRIILLFFLAFYFIPVSGQDMVFNEQFDNNENGWKLFQAKSNTSGIDGGHYNWAQSADGGNVVSSYINLLNDTKDFSAEARIAVKRVGSEYGLFSGIDQENGIFLVIKNLQYCVFEYKKNKYVPVKDWTTSLHIRPDKNIFKISKSGETIRFSINNHEVHETNTIKIGGKGFGFAQWKSSSISVDYLTIQGEKLAINLAKNLYYAEPPENLGAAINTKSDELTPVITSDGKGIYFSRTYYPENQGGVTDYQDVYFSQLSNGKWSKGINIGTPVNSHGPNAVSAVSADGNSLLLMNTYDNKGETQSMGISMSHKINKGWSVPQPVAIRNYYNRSFYNEYHLSSDNKIILLALQRDDTYGTRDIYVSFLQKDGTWSTPSNLGPIVNTPGTELSPFLAADNVTLYFSSTGHPGYGKNDVFLTRRLDDTWTNWSKPENMGEPLNTKGLDAYYTIPASGEHAYFVSEVNAIGGSDIFRIKLPSAVKPKPVVVVYGKVLNSKTKEPIATGITYHDLESDDQMGIARSNPDDGGYRIVLPYDKSYSFFAEKDGFYSVRDSIDVPNVTEYTEIRRDIYLTPIEVGAQVALKNVFFVRSEATLIPTSFPELNKLVKLLQENPNIEIEIEGHTDNVGSAEKNVILSEQRVERVKQYLVEKGIDGNRISGRGFGGSKPIADNSREETRKLNRRVEFRIVKI